MAGQKKYKRTQYLVDKDIQYMFMGLLLFYISVFFIISLVIIYFSGWSRLIKEMANVYPQAILTGILNKVYVRLFIGFLLFLPMAIISTILVSHKIAGPLVKIRRALRQLAAGDYNFTIKLRKHDKLKDVASDINKLAQSLKNKNVPDKTYN